jgi:protoheme IX farnesyltransferase
MATTFTREGHGDPAPVPDGRGGVRDYIQLAKPRIVLLLIFTTVTAMVVAARGQALPLLTLAATILGGSLASAGASAFNQYLDRDMDGQMARTRNRPIPSGRIAPWRALIFAHVLVGASVVILATLVNPLSAALAFGGAVYYVVVYTILLKRNTVLNILIGGGAGAMPVLVGWAAATGTLAPGAFVLFAIVFYWTPPHSWALALLVNRDYAAVNVPMMPVARGEEAARTQILLYAAQLVALSLLPLPLRMLGWFYFGAALLLGLGLLYECVRLLHEKTGAAARRAYKYSTFYLALLFLAMIVDQVLFRAF